MIDEYRQREKSVQCVGWPLNQLQQEITVRNQMCGCLALLVWFVDTTFNFIVLSILMVVSVVVQYCWYVEIYDTNTYTCIWMSWMISSSLFLTMWWTCIFGYMTVYEIVAQCEPHKEIVNVLEVASAIR